MFCKVGGQKDSLGMVFNLVLEVARGLGEELKMPQGGSLCESSLKWGQRLHCSGFWSSGHQQQEELEAGRGDPYLHPQHSRDEAGLRMQ